MNSKPFVPTEAELKELGFTKIEGCYELGTRTSILLYYPVTTRFEFGLDDVYPKSLEELKTLISMMRP